MALNDVSGVFKQDLSYGLKIQGNDDPERIFRETSFRDISSRRLHLWLCVCLLMVKGAWWWHAIGWVCINVNVYVGECS